MLYKVEMEFADPDDTEWRDVYIGFKKLPFVQTLLFGNQKRPYGYDHLNSSRYNIFVERPTFIDAFNDDARRFGAAAYGVSDDQMFNWRFGPYLGDKIQDSDSFYRGDHLQGEIAGRMASTVWYPEEAKGRDYLHLALAGAVAFPDGSSDSTNNTARFRARPEARTNNRWINTGFIDGADQYELIGVETVFNKGRYQFTGEYQPNWTQRDGGSELFFWGAYVQLGIFLTDDYMAWSRKSGTLGRIKPKENFFYRGEEGWGWGAWQIAFRYSYADLSDDDIQGGIAQNYTTGMNWYWNPNSRVQFNWIHGEIDHSGELEANGFSRAKYDNVGVRLMVDF